MLSWQEAPSPQRDWRPSRAGGPSRRCKPTSSQWVAESPSAWPLSPDTDLRACGSRCRVGTAVAPEPPSPLTNVLSPSHLPRADEIEMIMTDLERANQVGRLMASGVQSQERSPFCSLTRGFSKLGGQLVLYLSHTAVDVDAFSDVMRNT